MARLVWLQYAQIVTPSIPIHPNIETNPMVPKATFVSVTISISSLVVIVEVFAELGKNQIRDLANYTIIY